MSSPVKPIDFKNVISNPSSTMCGNFLNTLLKLPVLVYRFVNWLIDDNGNLRQGVDSPTSSIIPAGDLIFCAKASTRTDRLLCDGGGYSASVYPDLFAVIGTFYGGTGGNFNVPDYRGRFPCGVGTAGSTSIGLGSTGGEDQVTLDSSQVPSHTHTYNDPLSGSVSVPSAGSGTPPVGQIAKFTTAGGGTTDPSGSGSAHNNLPPYIGVYVYIKT